MSKMIDDMLMEGFLEGFQIGMKKEERAAATRMLKAGKLEFTEISMYSGLSLEEVEKLSLELGL